MKATEPLTARASGKIKLNPTYKLKPKKVQVAAGEKKTLKLKPKKSAARKIAAALKRGETATARVKVKLTDPAGNGETERLRVAEAVTSRSNSDRLALRQARIDVDDADDLIHEAESVGCGRG